MGSRKAKAAGRGSSRSPSRRRRAPDAGATEAPPPPSTPGAAARAEALEYRGLGRSELAAGYRRRRVHALIREGYSVEAIVHETGWGYGDVQKHAAELADAAPGLELDEQRATVLEAMADVGPASPAYGGLAHQLLEIAKARRRVGRGTANPLEAILPMARGARARGSVVGAVEVVSAGAGVRGGAAAALAPAQAVAVLALRAHGFPAGMIAQLTGRRRSVVKRYLSRIGLSFRGRGPYDMDQDLRLVQARADARRQMAVLMLTEGGAATDERGAALVRVLDGIDRTEHVILRDVGLRKVGDDTAERPDASVLQRAAALPLAQRRAEAARIIELHRQRANPEIYERKVELLEAGRPGAQAVDVREGGRGE